MAAAHALMSGGVEKFGELEHRQGLRKFPQAPKGRHDVNNVNRARPYARGELREQRFDGCEGDGDRGAARRDEHEVRLA